MQRNNIQRTRISKEGKVFRNSSSCINPGCILSWGVIYSFLLVFSFILAIYLLPPFPVNLVLLGIDYTKPTNFVGRSDTIMLISLDPENSSIDLLSIPRDLWIDIPGVGENRINSVHFFAEAQKAGSGPDAVIRVLQQSFGFPADYYVRIKFEGFRQIVDAMGGIDIKLNKPTAGYPAGIHHLNGRKTLAFARDRRGTDDFFRMERGQFIIHSAIDNLKKPANWHRIPAVIKAIYKSVDTNIPVWLFPRLFFLFLRYNNNLNNHMITRTMVTPYTTDQGASVLLPDWLQIHNLLQEMFGD